MANETDVADFYKRTEDSWTWFPQGMAISRILGRKLLAENVVVSHRGTTTEGNVGRERLGGTLSDIRAVLLL